MDAIRALGGAFRALGRRFRLFGFAALLALLAVASTAADAAGWSLLYLLLGPLLAVKLLRHASAALAEGSRSRARSTGKAALGLLGLRAFVGVLWLFVALPVLGGAVEVIGPGRLGRVLLGVRPPSAIPPGGYLLLAGALLVVFAVRLHFELAEPVYVLSDRGITDSVRRSVELARERYADIVPFAALSTGLGLLVSLPGFYIVLRDTAEDAGVAAVDGGWGVPLFLLAALAASLRYAYLAAYCRAVEPELGGDGTDGDRQAGSAERLTPEAVGTDD